MTITPIVVPSTRVQYRRPEIILRAANHMLRTHRYSEAEYLLRTYIKSEPEQASILAAYGSVLGILSRHEEAFFYFDKAVQLDPRSSTIITSMIFAIDRTIGATLEEAFQARRRYNAIVARTPPASWPNDPDPDRKLRVGYVSADFFQHSAAFGFGPVLLMHAGRPQVEAYVYSMGHDFDWVTDALKAKVPNWRDLADCSDDELEAAVQADEIDILVDLSGYSGGNRLPVFARKPAPVQVTAWGYITGTGLDAMDYMFADEIIIRPGEEQWYAEEPIFLPTFIPYWPPDETNLGGVSPLPALDAAGLTFGVMGRLSKINDGSIHLWARILERLPTALLIVKAGGLENRRSRARLISQFEAAGADLTRIELRGASGQLEHLKSYNQVDVQLDPWPDGGGITTLEAAWMGVPTLTMPHNLISSRTSASVMMNLGLDTMIVTSPEEYVDRAVALDDQRSDLASVRSVMRDMMYVSDFCDHEKYVMGVELAYREIWKRYCEGRGPGKRQADAIRPD